MHGRYRPTRSRLFRGEYALWSTRGGVFATTPAGDLIYFHSRAEARAYAAKVAR